IRHTSGNQWVIVSSINCSKDVINVCDSLHDTYIKPHCISYSLFSNFRLDVSSYLINIQRHSNKCDCGLFAIAVAFELVTGNDPLKQRFI
uniref:Ubiquitin-like protease family profile domain-containing protein n=1 Tax=Amphimedon queenslandica TaxID=400682 RepID=A0A1X7U825_AMPQE